jgi:hypothetical protein
MLGLTSIWTNLAAVIVGCVTLMGVGVFFVRASNIERRGMVAAVTLIACAVSIYLLLIAPRVPAREVPTAAAAVAISILGFVAARVIDFALGPRIIPTTGRDPATYDADLAD